MSGPSCLICIVAVFYSVNAMAQPKEFNFGESEVRDAEVRTAYERLFEVAIECNGWISIHAAEALIKLGMTEHLRARYVEYASDFDRTEHRVGVLRVLSLLAESREERERYVSELQGIFANSANTDRRQALETLCKLGIVPSESILNELKNMSKDGGTPEGVYALWSLTLANDYVARNSLVNKLKSGNPDIRRRAAYALRWISPEDPVILNRLEQARAIEANPSAKIYMTCAAIRVMRSSMVPKGFYKYLWEELESANDRDKYEILQTLMFSMDLHEVRILKSESFSKGDAEVVALWATIYVMQARAYGMNGKL